MSGYLQRVGSASILEQREHEGWLARLHQSKHKGRVTARALVVGGGPHARRAEEGTYRAAAERTFEIDPIVVRRETAADRFGKKLGLNLEACLGDDALDKAYYFETDTRPEIVRALFADPTLRNALAEVLDSGDVVIVGPPDGAAAIVRDRAPTTLELDPFALAPLVRLAAALPSIRARPPKSQLAQVLPMIALSFSIQLGIFPVVFVANASNAVSGILVGTPVLIGLGAALALSLTVFLIAFRKRANGFFPWLLASLGALVVLPGIAIALANTLNEAIDSSTPRSYEARVVRFRMPIKKKQRSLLLVKGLPPSLVEREGDGTQELGYRVMPAGERIFPNPRCGRLSLSIARGRFDNPWIVGAKCLP